MLLLLLGVALATQTARPPPLPSKDDCVVYEGTSSGNDPSVELSLRLCEAPSGAVSGEALWSSLVSGWNRREIAGTRTGATFTLRDVRVAEERPLPGWRFCVINPWTLTLNGDALTGTYHSEPCDDTAAVTLRRRADARVPGPSTP